jgi:hypothetical protein
MEFTTQEIPGLVQQLGHATGRHILPDVRATELTDTDVLSIVHSAFREHADWGLAVNRVQHTIPVPEYDETRSTEMLSPLDAMAILATCWTHYKNGSNLAATKLDKIIRYADAMKAGSWTFDPSAQDITLVDGVVANGRRRLHAILLSSTSQQFNITRRTTKENSNGSNHS